MDNKQYKIAVVGRRDTILPFQMVGFDTFPVQMEREAQNTIRKLAQTGYGIIYITEDIAALIPETLDYYDKQVIPALILLPTHEGSSGLALGRVQENVEKAVGQNIL